MWLVIATNDGPTFIAFKGPGAEEKAREYYKNCDNAKTVTLVEIDFYNETEGTGYEHEFKER